MKHFLVFMLLGITWLYMIMRSVLIDGCGECLLETKRNAIRHPRMTDICVAYPNGWFSRT